MLKKQKNGTIFRTVFQKSTLCCYLEMLIVSAKVGTSHSSMKISNLPTVKPAPVSAMMNISSTPSTVDTADSATDKVTERYRYRAFSTTAA